MGAFTKRLILWEIGCKLPIEDVPMMVFISYILQSSVTELTFESETN